MVEQNTVMLSSSEPKRNSSSLIQHAKVQRNTCVETHASKMPIISSALHLSLQPTTTEVESNTRNKDNVGKEFNSDRPILAAEVSGSANEDKVADSNLKEIVGEESNNVFIYTKSSAGDKVNYIFSHCYNPYPYQFLSFPICYTEQYSV